MEHSRSTSFSTALAAVVGGIVGLEREPSRRAREPRTLRNVVNEQTGY